MTLARTRLWLGITGVGLTTTVAAVGLLLDVPGRIFADDRTIPALPSVLAALAWPLGWTLLLLPLDLLGGLVAIRQRPRIGRWAIGWLRGVALQLAVLLLAGLGLISATRAVGALGTALAVVLVGALLLSQLDHLARLGTAMRRTANHASRLSQAGIPTARVTTLDAGDAAFVGGFGGLFRPRLVVPAAWDGLPASTHRALLVRRRLAARAPRTRGIALALAWQLFGAVVAMLLVDVPDTTLGLVRFSLGTTLWSFLGVLVLPTPSRRAVTALDQAAAREVGAEPVAEAIVTLDRWQDDEPARTPFVETIFHPVPTPTARIAALPDSAPSLAGAWRVARLALPSGLASWSLLGRAVHCNLGRPALWWMLPGD